MRITIEGTVRQAENKLAAILATAVTLSTPRAVGWGGKPLWRPHGRRRVGAAPWGLYQGAPAEEALCKPEPQA